MDCLGLTLIFGGKMSFPFSSFAKTFFFCWKVPLQMKFRPSGQFFPVESFAKFEFNELQNYKTTHQPSLASDKTDNWGLRRENQPCWLKFNASFILQNNSSDPFFSFFLLHFLSEKIWKWRRHQLQRVLGFVFLVLPFIPKIYLKMGKTLKELNCHW